MTTQQAAIAALLVGLFLALVGFEFLGLVVLVIAVLVLLFS